MTCEHPQASRYQAHLHWMCCLCNRWFWGDKSLTPDTDIYGRPT